jgi:hypothetical protein
MRISINENENEKHKTFSNPVERKADITDTLNITQTNRRRTIHFHKAQHQTIVLSLIKALIIKLDKGA